MTTPALPVRQRSLAHTPLQLSDCCGILGLLQPAQPPACSTVALDVFTLPFNQCMPLDTQCNGSFRGEPPSPCHVLYWSVFSSRDWSMHGVYLGASTLIRPQLDSSWVTIESNWLVFYPHAHTRAFGLEPARGCYHNESACGSLSKGISLHWITWRLLPFAYWCIFYSCSDVTPSSTIFYLCPPKLKAPICRFGDSNNFALHSTHQLNEGNQVLTAYAKGKPWLATQPDSWHKWWPCWSRHEGRYHLTIQQSFRVMIGPSLRKIQHCL